MNYVVHYCKNKQCTNAWIDKDITKAKSKPPKWKYCVDCCKKFEINFNKQELTLSKEQKIKLELMHKARYKK